MGMKRLKKIENNVEIDATNMEKYMKELSQACRDIFRATGAIFEQEHLRFHHGAPKTKTNYLADSCSALRGFFVSYNEIRKLAAGSSSHTTSSRFPTLRRPASGFSQRLGAKARLADAPL